MRDELKNMLRLGSIYSIANIFQRILTLVFVPIYTSYLTPEDYGVIGLMTVTISWIGKFSNAPVGRGITRFYHSTEYKDKQGEMLFSGIIFVVVQAVILSVVFFLASKPITILLLGQQELERITRAYALILLANPIGSVWSAIFRIKGKAKYYSIVSFCRFLLTAFLQIYLLVWQKLGIMAMVYASIFENWFDVFAMGPYILNQIRYKFRWNLLKPILQYGYPLIVGAVAATLTSTVSNYTLRLFGTLSIVGLYSFATSIAGVFNMLMTIPLKQALLPVVFGMGDKPEHQRAFVKRSSTYVFAVAILVFLGMSSIVKEGVMILARDPNFWDAWLAVPFLLFGQVNITMGYYFGNGLEMAKKSGLISTTYVVRLIANLCLLLILVPVFGLVGSAFASMMAEVFHNAIQAFLSRKFYRQEFELTRLLKITGIAVFLLGMMYAVSLQDIPIIIGVLVKLFLVMLYPVSFWITGLLNAHEKKQVKVLFKRYLSGGIQEIFQSIKSLWRV